MSTTIYGASDDLIEFEGDVYGEVGCYGHDSEDEAVLLFCSDGTLLRMWYGHGGIWCIRCVFPGILFDRIEQCHDANADPHSDVAYFKGGLKAAYVAKEWSKAE
jgi:hypothetical protein